MSNESSFFYYYVQDKNAFDDVQEDAKLDGGGGGAPQLKRCLGLFDLILFGIAAIIGAGIFVVTGLEAKINAGPAVIVSYLIAGLVAMLVAVCYAELSTEVSYTGGTFVYACKLYGRGLGWFVAVNVLCEYALGAATVSIGFSNYLATLCGLPGDALQVAVGSNGFHLNPVAAALVFVLTCALLFGVRESFYVNTATVLITVSAILITIIAGATKITPSNYVPFVPPEKGVGGVVSAASAVFFSYIGFDMIVQGAEEAKNPARDVPIAVMAATGTCTALYMGAAATIVGLVKYTDISAEAPFANAFSAIPSLQWAVYVVSLGAVCATFNTVLTILYSLQRITVVLARTHLLPSFLAHIWKRRQTPAAAGAVTGTIIMVIAFCVPLDVLVGAVSMGTLTAFSAVCFGVAWRQRYTGRGCGTPKWKLLPSAFTVFAAPLTLGLTLTYAPDEVAAWPAYLVLTLLWAGATASFHAFPIRYTAKAFSVPLKPWLPCLGVGMSMFLAGTLSVTTWKVWLAAQALGLAVFAINGTCLYVRGGWGGSSLPSAHGRAVAVPALGHGKDVGNGDAERAGTLDLGALSSAMIGRQASAVTRQASELVGRSASARGAHKDSPI